MKTTWKITPQWKKSIIEKNYWTKGPDTIIQITGWRGGEFIVITDDENPPNIEAGVDIYNCGYESELVETYDGCWEELDFDDCVDSVRELVEEFLDEGNSVYDLEEQGWICNDAEMIIDCDLNIEKVIE